jgi:hypothetical protein
VGPVEPHLLPTGQAAACANTYLFSGKLTGWRQPKVLRSLLNSSARAAYRIPIVAETQARAILTLVTQPNPGDSVVVGELTYTFQSVLAPQATGGAGLPGDVLIGATATVTATNFANAVTADLGQNTNAGVLYGTNTVSNSDVFFAAPGTTAPVGLVGPSVAGNQATFGAPDFGASYNTLLVADSTGGARLLWNGTTFTGGSNPSSDITILGPSTWMEFLDPDTDVVKSPIVSDEWNRFYFASPSTVPQYNTYDRIAAGQAPWKLGVPPPGCAPIVSGTGGGNNLAIGNVTTNNTQGWILGNSVFLQPFTTPGSTQIQDVQFISADSDTTTRWAAVIYQDAGGSPGELLNTGIVQTGVSSTANNISSFLNPSNLIGNTQYWLGIIIDTQHLVLGGTIPSTSFPATFSNGPPGTAPAGLVANEPGINMWGDFVTSDVLEARAYAYTWLSAYGEEGPPSPPTLLNGWSNGTWTLDLWQPPPDDLGIVRNLKTINIYRTVPGQGGATVFFFVANVPIGTAQYVDTLADNVVALNAQLASTTWFPPPENLQGFKLMQNGMIAAFIGNAVWFCEPYRPHAWPPSYVLTVDFPIVGLGLTNGALVVATSAQPFVITGSAPSQMTQQKCSLANPCSSRASILDGDGAVSYLSPNGLIQVTGAGVATNTTDLWFTRENWQQLTPQKYGRAIFLSSCYFCLGTVSPPSVSPADASQAQRGFTIELDQDNTSFTIWPQPGGHRLGFNQLTAPVDGDIQNLMTDPWTGTGMLIADGDVWYFDFSDSNPAMLPYTWTSKIYQQNVKRNYSCMKVFFQVPPNTPAQNAIPNTAPASDPSWNALTSGQWGIIKTFVDYDGTGNLTLIDAREIRGSGEILRLVSGFKAEQWQWQILGRVNISNVQIASTPKELGTV